MDVPTMVSFPLPLMTATLFVVVAVLVWRLELGPLRANIMFTWLLGLCAAEALLVGLRFGYGVEHLIPLQRVLPLFFGPMIYLSFVSLTADTRDFLRIVSLHLAAWVLIFAAFLVLVDDQRQIDWLISASYVIYLVAVYRLWRKGPDALSYAHVEVTRGLSNWMLRGAGILIFVLLLDTAIALDFQWNKGVNAPMLISSGTVPFIIVLLVILITVPKMMAPPQTDARPSPSPNEQEAEVETRLRALMRREQLYLDPDLTVQRLARRLHLPARTLSAAINREESVNVSQYVNTFRLEHAAELLVQSEDSVTKIAAQSGFLSRSNFYREFQRVYGMSPKEFRIAGDIRKATRD